MKSQNIPQTMPVTSQDMFNYAARYGISNHTLQAVIHFKDKLDEAKLARAVRLSIDAEPVLGCFFVERENSPFWQRLFDPEKISWCRLEETKDREDSVMKFLLEPLNMDLDPQILALLLRYCQEDTLCIKLNHACCDGRSAREYLKLLAGLYTKLCRDPSFEPEPNVQGKRDQSAVLEAQGITELKSSLIPEETEPTWAFPWQRSAEQESMQFSVTRIPSGNFRNIAAYARAHGATINDIILTAYFRALFDMIEPKLYAPMEIQFTVDLRRYLPEEENISISNLSGIESLRLPGIKCESFTSTLERVVLAMKRIKIHFPGMQSALACELMRGMNSQEVLETVKKEWQTSLVSGKSSPMLTNLGVISPTPLFFGEVEAEDAYVVTPAFHAPAFMLGASTYNEVLTLTAGYYESATKKEDVDHFLDLVVGGLSSCDIRTDRA